MGLLCDIPERQFTSEWVSLSVTASHSGDVRTAIRELAPTSTDCTDGYEIHS